jgi:hypothetical protein
MVSLGRSVTYDTDGGSATRLSALVVSVVPSPGLPTTPWGHTVPDDREGWSCGIWRHVLDTHLRCDRRLGAVRRAALSKAVCVTHDEV